MKAFWQLLRKDLLAQRWAVGILLGLSFVYLLLYSKIGIWYPSYLIVRFNSVLLYSYGYCGLAFKCIGRVG